MSVATISGAVSGLDTQSIINGLVSAESNQQTLLKNRQTSAKSASTAYSDLISAMNTLATQAGNLAKTSSWVGTTATSSSTSVSAKATGTTSASITFDVTDVAARHTLISSDTVASTSDTIASGGSLTVTKDDGTTSAIDVGGGSLAEVVAAVNASSSGLRAAAVQVSSGQYKLQVTSGSTGAASAFTLDGLDGSPLAVLTQGADAQIKIGGDSAAAYTATSPTNTFSGLVPGLSFTVSKRELGVTVSSDVDGTAVGAQVKTLVDDANAVLSKFTSDTTWNASTKSGGPLLGTGVIRSLQQQILSAVGGAGAAGVQLTRDGTITFDQDAFNTAFKADPAGVAKQFGAQVSFSPASGVTGTTTLLRAGGTTSPGTYAVGVTQTAAREQWQFDNLQGPPWSGHTISLTAGSTTIDYTPSDSDTLNDVVSTLNTRIRAAGLGIAVGANGTTVVFTSDSPGSSAAFTVADTGADAAVAHQVTAGRDVAGTIDGQAATGSGTVLSLLKGTGGAVGLSLDTNFSDSDISASGGAVGSVTFRPGLAQSLLRVASLATDSTNGSLVTAQNTQNKQVKDLQDQIDAWDTRLSAYRARLTTQFTAMETALAALKSNTSALSGLTTASSTS